MAPPSLVDICVRKCIKHASMIHDLGELPSHLAKPILRRVENPDQLHEIELGSPQLAEEVVEVWKKLIARDFPKWHRKNYVPKRPDLWYRVYKKYKKENDADIAAANDKLKNTFAALKAHKDSRTTEVLRTKDLSRLPQQPKEMRNAPAKRGKKELPDHLTWGGGSRTKVTDGVTKARREAREIAMRLKLSTPSGQLKVPQGQIKKAPEAMVQKYRVQAQGEFRIRAPRKSKTEAQLAEEAERRDREARLLSIKNMKGVRPEQVVSDSEDSDQYDDDEAEDTTNYRGLADILGLDEDEDDVDLFGERVEDEGNASEPVRSSTSATRKKPASTTTYQSDSSAAPARPAGLLSNSRRPGSGILNFKPSSTQKRPASSPPKSSTVASKPRPQQGSPPPRPRQAVQSSPSPPQRSRPPQSSPPPSADSAARAQPSQASPALRPQQSPPLRPLKRKPQVAVFMQQNKRPKK